MCATGRRAAKLHLTKPMRSPNAKTSRSFVALLLGLAVALLALLHVGLLIERLGQGTPTDPAVLLRWVGALALLLAAGFWQRRTGRSLWAGREALVFWTLVALLHAGAPAQPFENAPEVTSSLVLGIAFGIFGLLAADAAATRRAAVLRLRPELRVSLPAGPSGGPLFAPRPPPVFRVA